MVTSHRPHNGISRESTRGVASLAVTLIMLAVSALVLLYVNRGQLFEQRISANQLRATTAFEVAEAGIEWATARMNDETRILPSNTSDCTPSANVNADSFQSFYAPGTPDPTNLTVYDFNPLQNSRAACAVANDGSTTCQCATPTNAPPTALNAPNLAAPGARSFVVSFHDVPADVGAVEIRSQGCLNAVNAAGNAVQCGAANSTSDATAIVRVIVKRVPGSGNIGESPIKAGRNARICSVYTVTNTGSGGSDSGILVNSGGQTRIGNGTYLSGAFPNGVQSNCGGNPVLTSIPGSPIAATVRPNDANLNAASQTTDQMMVSTFGMTLAQYQAPPGCVVANMTELNAAYTRPINPCSRFWVNGDIQLAGGQVLGSLERPVMIATAGDIQLNGGSTVYGIIYGDDINNDYNGTGGATIYGQLIVRGNLYINANGSIIYNSGVLQRTTLASDEFIRVPGSWRDFP